MPTEDQIETHVRRYLEATPTFTNNKTKAINDGCTAVTDDVTVTLKNACGHPTASLLRSYCHPDQQWHPLRSTFDVTLVRGEWHVRCSSGFPGGLD